MAVAAADLIKQIDEMTVLELNTLVKELEEHYGVSAAAAAVPMAGMAGAGEAQEAEEQTEFDVQLTSFGDKKIAVIKVVREVTSLVSRRPRTWSSRRRSRSRSVSKEEAEEVKGKLEEAGGQAEVK